MIHHFRWNIIRHSERGGWLAGETWREKTDRMSGNQVRVMHLSIPLQCHSAAAWPLIGREGPATLHVFNPGQVQSDVCVFVQSKVTNNEESSR